MGILGMLTIHLNLYRWLWSW